MTGVEDTKGNGGGDGTNIGATDNLVQQNGGSEKAPVVAGTNMETLPRPGKQSDPSTAFLRAARAGQLEKVLEFLESGVDINASNANGLNALHLAAKDGHLEIVRELLKRGATVDAATKKGNTALHIASLAGQEEVVQLLVQKGASVNAQSQNGFTPLYMAAQENHDSVVKFLLNKGANQTLATEDGFTPLAVAMQQGHDKVVAVLLENDTRGKVRLPALHIAAKKDDCKAAALLLQNDHNPDVTSKSGFTPLHIAAHYGNDRIASLLYEKGADVNFAAKHNITPMHVAAKWGKIKMVNLLMSKGANISAKTRDGLTPLHCAARAGHHEVVDILIEKGAPIGSKTKNGLAPLHMASQGDHVDAARILLYHRAPVDEVTVDYLTALHVAAHCGHVRVAKLLLDRNADPNARALNGFTPLHIACKKNRIKVVELLLKHKASIEATTESGLTPLHVASFMGCMNIVIYLLQNEASPDIPTVRGETPLHLAARANQTDIIRILLRNGAQVDARAREEQTPLHVASRLGNVDIVMLLLQHGADVDATTKDLYTPLHIAAKEGQEEVASVLLENGASLTATTKKGFTPLHLAAKYGNMNVARLLLQKNAPVDAQGKNGVTPLHVASHYDHQNVALLLLDKGASPHAMAKNGHTPLHIAARKNQMDIATTLLEYGAKANAESKAGFTPLHLSAQEGHTDMSTLLIEHKADTNHQAKNGLTPLHLCAQEDKTNVATILVKNGAQIDAKTKAGYTPLHVAAHFGQASMVRFLLRNGAGVNSSTGAGYTPLHQAAQQGHTLIINLLLESKAKANATTNNGQTALAIAQKLGYISVVETLKVVTETVITTTQTITIEEKYKVQAPESMQETFMSDSEDEGGGDEIGMATMNVYGQPPHAQHVYLPSYYQGQMTYTREDPMLSDQQQYRYMTVDDMKSMGDDSMRVNVTDDEKDNRHSGGITVTDMITKENYARTNAPNLKTDNIDIHRHPVHVGIPQWKNFLVSFLVDARGGAMRGCRHSGVRVIVPPRKAAMPMRVTCRYLKRDKLTNPPPLMEGEALASRILELGPVGAKFLGPVIIEVPHFASLRGKEREIVILRSDNGETWREHTLEASEEAVQDVLNESFEGEELSQLEDLQTSRIVRILTVDFPHYFAVVSRIRQEVHAVGPEGGTVSSSAVPQVQAVFPPAALTKKIRVGLQAHPIPVELVAKLLGNRVAVSPIVTVEPRRRKFHKPITLTIPVPQAANKGMINQYSGETPTLRLLCSITGGQSRAVWEDVTGSTPLQFVKDCVSFTTTVSARFWLMDCRNVTEATKMATELYTHATHVPFMAKFVVFAKRVDPLEARLRVFCMTDDKEDKTLEHQEHFTEVAKSRDVEVLEGKTQYMEFAGNLVPVLKSGEQLQLPFRGFKENRVPFTARVKDPDAADMVGRIIFMSEPKVAKGEPPQTPICTLNILLPEKISPDAGHSELDLLELSKNYSFLRDGGISRPDTIHRATIRLTDIANLLDHDWEKLAEELNISPGDVEFIKNEHPEKPALQAATMFKIWQSHGNKATGNTLEKALNKIGREDIVKKCIFNVELVTDDVEKAVARVRLDQPGFDSLKEELGPSRDSSLRRDGTLGDRKLDIDYDEPDRMKDSESIEDLRATKDVPHKPTKPQHITINGTAFNGTSTPIKDKYAGDEKELHDDMADFLEYKCHKTDTMTKRIRDEADDDNKNRQKIIEDANRLVTGVLQDAEKEKEKLAKEGLSGVYHDDASKEAEGAIGKIEGIVVKESVGRGEQSIEPIIQKKHKTIVSPHGTVVTTTISTTTRGSPDSALIIDRTTNIRENITMSQSVEKPIVDPSKDYEDDPTVSKSRKSSENAYEVVYNINKEESKTDGGKKKDKTGIFSNIFKGPKTKELKGKKDHKDGSLDSGDEDIKITKEFVGETEKGADEKQLSPKFEYPAFDPATYIAICPPKLPENEPNRDTIWATADFLYDSRRSAEAFLPEAEKPASDVGKMADEVPQKSDDQKEKSGFFSSLFKGSKKHETHVDSNIQESETKGSDIPEKIDGVHKSVKEVKHMSMEISKDSVDSEIKSLKDEVNKAITDGEKKIVDDHAKHQTTEIISTTEKVESSEDKIKRDNKKTAEELNADLKEVADNAKNKSGGFFGIFKSPKNKNRRSRSRDTSKDVSFDSGDEELRTSTAAFLEDTKKTADRTLSESKAEAELKLIDKVEKFITEVPEKFDMPKDSIKGSSYDVTVSPVPKSEVKTAKTLTSDEESSAADPSPKQKSIHVSRGTGKKRKDSTDREDSADETKPKGSRSFFGKFKSPKLRTKSKSRSRDRSTSTEPSFDSGDEELRITTSKFLNENRKIADQINEFDEGNEKAPDDVLIETKTAVEDNRGETVIDTKSKDDDIKNKGGFFGIFKSPKSAKKRSKSQEKRSSAEISSDDADDKLKMTTAKLLDDTRHISDVMDEHPYPSAPTIKSPDKEKSHEDHQQGAVKVPEKTGSQSSILDTTKAIIDKVADDIKEFRDETKEEADAEAKVKQEVKLETPKIKEELPVKAEQQKVDSKISPVLPGKTQKTAKAIPKSTESTPKVSKKETAVTKVKTTIKGRSSDSPKTPSTKPEKDSEKTKEKSAGFLTDIIKGAKHAVDEISEDVKEFWDETKEEAQKEEDHVEREKDVNGTVHDKSKEKTGNVAAAASKVTKGKTPQTGKLVKTAAVTKNGSNGESKKMVVEPKEDIKTATKKVTNKDKVPAAKGKAPKVIIPEKSKVPKDSTEKAKPGKDSTDAKPVKQPAPTKPTKPIESSTVQKPKVTKVVAPEKAKATKPPSPNGAKKPTVKQVKKDVKLVKSKVDDGSKPSVAKDTIIEKKDEDSDFFSGIINGAKSAVHEVTEDIKEFVAETKVEAVEVEKTPKEVMDEKSPKIAAIKDGETPKIDKEGKDKDMISAISTPGKDAADEVVKEMKEFMDMTERETKQEEAELAKRLSSKITKVSETSESTIKTAGDTISSTASQVSETTGTAGKKVTEDLEAVEKIGHDEINKNAEFLKNEIADVSSTATDSVKTGKDKIEKGAKKSKDKTKGFFSGIFKGAKHGADEVVDNIKDGIASSEDKVKQSDEKISKQISDAKREIIDTSIDGKDAILDATDRAGDRIATTAAQSSEMTQNAAKIAIDDVKKVGAVVDEKMKTEAGSLDNKMKDAAATIHDATEEEAKKTEEKTKGFFSGIFRGVKQEATAAVEDGKDGVKKTGDKIERSERKTIEQVSEITGDIADTGKKMKDGITEAGVAGKETIVHAAEQATDVISSTAAEASKVTKDAAKKIDDDLKKVEDSERRKLEKTAESLKHEVTDAATAIGETAEASKDELEKESTKAKEKTKGFFSGIFKGVKHEVDDGIDETKSLMKKTEDKIKGDEQKMAKQVSDAGADIEETAEKMKKKMIEVGVTGKDAVLDVAKRTSEGVSSTVTDISGVGHDDVKKIDDNIKEVENIDKKRMSQDVESLKSRGIDAEGSGKIESKTTKGKDKTKGFFGIFKGAKHEADGAVDSTKSLLEKTEKRIDDNEGKIVKQLADTKDDIIGSARKMTDNIGDNVERTSDLLLSTTVQTSATVSDATGRFLDDLKKEEEVTREAMKKDVEYLNDKVTDAVDSVDDTMKMSKEKMEKEGMKTKEKTKGFFSGIFKGTKRETDGVVDDVGKYIEKAEDKIEHKKQKITKQVSDAKEKMADTAGEIKDEIVDARIAGKNAVLDAAKQTDDVITRSAEQASRVTQDTAKKIVDDAKQVKDAASEEIEKDAEALKNRITHGKDAVADTVEAGKDKIEKDATKAKEKTKGFFSGIFKGAKHGIDEAADDVKDSVEKTGQKIEQSEQKIAKTASDTKQSITDTAEKMKEEIIDTGVSGKNAVLDATKKTGNVITSSADQASKMTQDTAKKVIDDVEEVREAASEEIKKDAESLKDGITHGKDAVADAVEAGKDKIEKDATKAKEKTTGFFSGIFKGAKYELDEVADDVKDSVKKTEDKMERGEQKLAQKVSDTKDSITDTAAKVKGEIIDAGASGKDAVLDATKKTSEVITSGADKASKLTQDTAKKVIDDTKKAKGAASEEMKKDTEILKDKITHVTAAATETVEAGKDKIEKDATRAKEKTKGFFSGIFKGAKHEIDEATDDVKDSVQKTGDKMKQSEQKLAEKVSDTKDSITDTAEKVKGEIIDAGVAGKDVVLDATKQTGDVVSSTAQEASALTHDTAKKIIDDVKQVREAARGEIKKDAESLKDKIDHGKDAVADTVESGKDKIEKDATKAKEKTKGFFSGIFKGAKHELDEAADDVKDSVEKTGDKMKQSGQNLAEKVSDTKRSITDSAEKMKEEIIDTGVSGKDAVLDATKKTSDIITSSAEQASELTQDTAKKVIDDTKKSKEAASEEMKKDTEMLKDKITHASAAATETVEAGKDKIEKDATKAKEKTKGFFSGIFKGAKHEMDEATDDVKDSVQKTGDKIRQSEQKLAQKVSDTKDSITDTAEKVKEDVIHVVAESAEHASKVTQDTAKEVIDDAKQVKEAASKDIKKDTESFKDKATHGKDAVTDTVEAGKDKFEKDATKAKEKTRGFFSGIFKGAKHEIDEAADDVKDSVEKTGDKIRHSEQNIADKVSDTKQSITDTAEMMKKEIIDAGVSGKNAILDANEKTTEVITSSAEQASKLTQDTAKKVIDNTKKVKGTASEEMKKDAESLKSKIIHGKDAVADTVEAGKDKIEKDAIKAKEKTKGFFSGIFKGAKHEVDDAKELLGTTEKKKEGSQERIVQQLSDTKKDITHSTRQMEAEMLNAVDRTGDGISRATVENAETAKDVTKKFIDDMKKAEEVGREEIEEAALSLENKLSDAANDVDDVVNTNKDEIEAEASKTKEKTKGFLSGILKGVKHESDKAIHDVKDEMKKTEKEIQSSEQRMKKQISDVKEIQGKIESSGEMKIAQVSDTTENSADAVNKIKESIIDDVKQTAEATQDKLDKETAKGKEKTKGFFSGILKGVKHESDKAIDGAKDSMKKTEKAIQSSEQKMKKQISDVKEIQGKIESSGETIIAQVSDTTKDSADAVNKTKESIIDDVEQTAEVTQDKLDKETAKGKEKTKGFLSGILKGVKHESDKAIDDAKDVMKKTEKEIESSEQRMKKQISDVKEIQGKIESGGETIIAQVSDTTKDSADAVNKVKESIIDDVEQTAEATQDKLDKETAKGKEKTKGFLSGILKGVKHESDKAIDGAKDSMEKTEKEIQSSEQRMKKQISDVKEIQGKIESGGETIIAQVSDTTKDSADAVNKTKESIIDDVKRTAEATQDKLDKETAKGKEKTKGFFSGILKGAKHESDKAIDGAKDSMEKTEKEIQSSEQRMKKQISDVKEIQGKIESGGETIIAQVLDTPKDSADAVNKIKESIIDDVEQTAEATQDKLDKETAKDKEKTEGFLSGILKGVQHESDKAIDSAKDSMKKTEKEIQSSKQRMKKQISDVKEIQGNIESSGETIIAQVSDTRKDSADAVNKIKEGIIDDVKQTAEATQDKLDKETAKGKEKTKGFFSGILKGVKHESDKAIDGAKDSMKKTEKEIQSSEQRMKKQISDVKEIQGKIESSGEIIIAQVSDTTKDSADAVNKIKEGIIDDVKQTAEATQDKLDKETAKGKEKTKGFFSGIFKGAKHTSEEVVEDAKSSVAKTKDKIGESEQKVSEQVSDVKDHIIDSVGKTKSKVSERISKDAKSIEGETINVAHDVAETVKATGDEIAAETKKSKERTEDFFSGVFEGSKHVADEVVGDSKKLIGKTHDSIEKGEQKLAEQVSDTKKSATDAARKTKDQIISTAAAGEEAVVDTVKATGDIISSTTAEISEKTQHEKSELKKDLTKTKEETKGFFSGIFKGAKHAADEVVGDMKEFIHETEQIAKEDEQKLSKKTPENVEQLVEEKQKKEEKTLKTADIKVAKDGTDDGNKTGTEKMKEITFGAVDDIPKDKREMESQAEKTKHKSSPIFGILKRPEAKASTAEGMKLPSESHDDMVDVSLTTDIDAENEITKGNKKKKDKSGNFLSGIIKGAKHAVGEISEDVKEFWDETKQSTKEEDVKLQPGQEKTVKHDKMKDSNKDHAIPEIAPVSTVDDPKLATLEFLEDTRATAIKLDDKISRSVESIPSVSVGAVSEYESPPTQTDHPEGKSKGVISHIVKGAKVATGKFWEDTKHESESSHDSGSYDISSPQSKTDESHDKTEKTLVKLESFGPIKIRSSESSLEGETVSRIPQKISAIAEFDKEIRVVSAETPLQKTIDDRDKAIGHLEPHTRQTVTTIVTKSSTRTKMSTPPPSPDELGDSRLKDVTEEAAKRAQSIAEQTHGIGESAEIDGTVERHVSTAPTMSHVPDPCSLKKKLDLNLGNDLNHPQSKTLKLKENEESSEKNKGCEAIDSTSITILSKSAMEDTAIPFTQTVTQVFENNDGRRFVHSTTSTSIKEPIIDLGESMSTKELMGSNYTEVSTTTIITEIIPASTSKEDSSTCGNAKDVPTSVSAKSSWESSTRIRDNQDNWEHRHFSLEASPDSGDPGFTKNSDSRQELPSDSDSDGSPRTRRRSLSKRRTLGSSSGSDVALHEGAELSPLEDDQESDFMQQSEPSYVETTTTEINPITNERITRTTRMTTSASTGTAGGSDELRESMQKIVDQFMTEERRGQ